MILLFKKYHRFLFYTTWLLLGLWQASSTQLIDDEAYYWVYSRFLSWGYFDHPPLIALLIRWGYVLFQDEAGVRLFSVLLNTATIWLMELLTEKKNSFLFYSLVLSIGIFQVGGFLAVPDTPLLFFSALFFYCYKKFSNGIHWKNAVLLGLVTSLLFYSKYHGLLVVAFSLLSGYRLLTRWPTWLAGFCVLVFYAPHLLWQWENNWVSFRYHLFESNVSPYHWSNTTDYLLGQILLAGPLVGLILLPAAFFYQPKTPEEKAMKYTLAGIYFLFLLSSFRGKVEANWPMPALVPLLVLGHRYLSQKPRWQNSLKFIFPVSLLLIIAGRIYLVTDIGPANAVKKRFHYNKEWAEIIAARTGDLPVVFYDSYQRASRFWFYSGKPSHSLNYYGNRKNNYDFWPTEDSLLGKPVFIAHVYDMHNYTDSVKTPTGWTGWKFDSLFSALGKIKITCENKMAAGGYSRSLLKCRVTIPPYYQKFLSAHPGIQPVLLAGIFKNNKLVKEINTGYTAHQLMTENYFQFSPDGAGLLAGRYTIVFSLRSEKYHPTHNSEKISLIIP